MTLTLKTVNNFFHVTHRLMIIHHHTKLGKIIVERFRSYQTDTIRHMDRTTDEQSDSNITESSVDAAMILHGLAAQVTRARLQQHCNASQSSKALSFSLAAQPLSHVIKTMTK